MFALQISLCLSGTAALTKTTKERLTVLGFNLNAIRGEYRGVQALIQIEYSKAVFTHCSAHCLNIYL